MTPLFRDRFGSFSSSEGEVILELLLLRREIARSHLKLLVKRAEHRGKNFLLLREVAKKSQELQRLLSEKKAVQA